MYRHGAVPIYLGVVTGSGIGLAAEQVGLAFLDARAILHMHRFRSGSFVFQRQRLGAIATATDLLEDLALLALGGQHVASEQIVLSRFDLCGISRGFRRSEEQVQMNRAIA